jgi:hypothetical protein
MYDEAKDSINLIQKIVNGLAQDVKDSHNLPTYTDLQIIYFNLKLHQKGYVESFISLDGVKQIFRLTYQSQLGKKVDYIQISLKMLVSIFGFVSRSMKIRQKQIEYFRQFFELPNLNFILKIQVLEIFKGNLGFPSDYLNTIF